MPMTYDSLVLQIQSYANRTDNYFIENIPSFINLAEAAINRDAKDIAQESTLTNNFTIGNPIIAKPANWNRPISFGYLPNPTGNYIYLSLQTYEYCKYYSAAIDETGAPLFYSDNPSNPYGELWISPAPDIDYSYILTYLIKPNYLSEAVQTNWLTENASDLLFFGAMINAMIFVRSDERIAFFGGLYKEKLDSINMQTKERYLDRVNIRDKV